MKQTEFLHIVMPFKDKVFRLAKRLLVSKDEAEDATQEVILKLWQNKEVIKKYKNVENEAKKINAGAWAGKFIFPWEWRKLKKNDR